MRKIQQDRSTRIVHKYSEAKKAEYLTNYEQILKDKIYYCRSRQEVLNLFDSMIINFGETLTLESLVDGEWVEQETKTKNKNKNKPKVAYQGEHTPVANPK